MTIRYDNPQLSEGEYNESRYELILWLEENGKVQYKPYTDAKHGGWATIGVGIKITDNLGAILDVLGFQNNPVDNQYREQIRKLFYSTNPQTGVETEKRFTSAEITTLYNDLNAKMQERYNYYAALGDTSKRKEFRFINESQVKTAFLNAVQKYENRLNTWLAGVNVPQSYERITLLSRVYNGAQNSNLKNAISDGNRAEAWFWMRYSGYTAKNNEGVSVEMNGLVKRRFAESELFGLYNDSTSVDADEAKQVYKMLQKYRTIIAQKEALYGISLDGTRGTKRDANGRTPLEAANADYKTILTEYLVDGKVDNLVAEFNPAKAALFAYLQGRSDLPDLLKGKLTDTNIASTNIYLNPHKPTDTNQTSVLDSFVYQTGQYANGANDLMIGMDQTDYMLGNKGNDVLIGEGGNDWLWGGEGADVLHGGGGNDALIGGDGDDTMYGGAGRDTYIFKFGEGNDTVIDSNGTTPTERSSLIYEDALGKRHDLGRVYSYAAGGISTADGMITYSNGVISLPGGGTITLQLAGGMNPLALPKNALTTSTLTEESSDPLLDAFGIDLIDLPGDIPALPDLEISNTIVGDLAPVDMDPETEGIQYGYDQWGNVIVDPGQPESGRSDVLYDTTASDKIEGLGGNDTITLSRGSGTGDWVLGGDGNDYITINASGNVLVEGGSGNDDIYTSAAELNARIYGDGGDDSITTDSTGSGWLYGGEGYDIIDAERLNNCVIEGGPGSDIVIGGVNGNNQVFGDSRGDGDLATVMATHIADGETALDSGVRGDFVVAGGENAVGENDNYIFGSNGYDIMWGGEGKDFIVAGAGNDLIISDAGGMFVFSDDRYTWSFHIQVEFDPSTGEDKYTPVITGLTYYDMDSSIDNDDLIYAGTGDDFVDAGGGDDEVYGGAGNDSIFGFEGNDFIEGGEGDDILVGDNGSYLPLELNGDDYIDGGAGNDSIWGNGGSDELYGGTGNDLLDGGEGNDYLAGEEDNDTLAGLEGDDYLDGGAGLNTLYGGDGNDVMFGGDDSDYILGEAGADEIYGGGGNDTLQGDASYVPLSDQGDDYIEGGAGDDFIYGYGGNNTLYGDDGNDQISADAGDDYIDGGDGANTLIGGDGNNEIYAGTGDDQILGGINSDYIDAGDGNNIVQSQDGDDEIYTGAGSDQIWGGAGADVIYGGAGNDAIYADDGNEFDGADFADGEEGDDTIIGAGGDDTLYGGDGNDYITGDVVGTSTGNDYLDGGAGADTLLGQAGDDTLYGGTDNDTMQGDSGSDTYIFGRGDGADIINNAADDYATAIDTIQIGVGINDVTMTLESSYLDLRISINGTNDSLLIWSWGSDPSCQADQIVFSDGTTLTPAQVQDYLANPIYGTSANNTINGGTGIDAIYGYAGDDNLSAGDGNDVLIGGVGNDTLVGGTGNDAYVFNLGDGVDTIQDTSTLPEGNTIYFGQGITPSDITVVKNGTTLTINVGTNGDAINLLNFDENETAGSLVARTLQFSDGTALAPTDFMNLRPPVVLDPIADQTAAEEAPFTFTVPEYTFYDFDINDTLTYGATKSDGSVLPSWLAFDPGTMTFSGTPPDAGDLSIKVTATDAVGHTVSDDFNLTVTNDVNDAPVVANPITDQIALKDAVFNFTVPINTFADVDPGDTLTYGATKSDGSALPSWLTFDPGTMTFSGTPANEDVGILPLKVTATDTAGASVSDEFNVAVDSAPVLANPIDDQNATEDAIFSFTVPGNTFSDEDPGDTLTYGATRSDGSALPSWMTFDPGTMTFSGTPANEDVGDLSLKVKATDAAGASVSDDFNVTVINVNDAPVVANPIDDQTATEDTAFSFTVPSNTFADVDLGDTLTYSATLSDGTALPSWLIFDPGTMNFSGTPGDEDVGVLPLKVTATDIAGATVSAPFDLTVQYNSITGTENDDNLTGTMHNDIIYGLGGNDTIDGVQGADTMIGGLGNDTYLVDNPSDVVTENAGEGTDTVLSSVTYTLGNYVENLTLTGTSTVDGTGNSMDNYLIGNTAANTLTGDTGNDTLDGGVGPDTMLGGAGDDTYYVDNTGDVITENASEGTDTVLSSVTYTLGNNVENLTLTGTSTVDGIGNTLNNVIIGNSAGNTLSGGTGADTMIGGAGNDTYGVDNTGDVITENASEGTDTVLSSVSYTLGNNVENLTLTGTSGISGTGNTLNNVITGNSASNTLSGGTGREADTMIGGAGNDYYSVDATGDVVIEYPGEGTDTVNCSATEYTLGDNVENLIIVWGGSDGTGNALDNAIVVRVNDFTYNYLIGGAGNDTLDGGQADDTMLGGAGDDTYYVDYNNADYGSDLVIEYPGEGTDTVYIYTGYYSDITSYTLPSNVENLILSGGVDGTGNDLDNYMAGSGDSIVTGGAGNDTLAGSGADTLIGGDGNDTYIVYGTGNVVDERGSKGTDTVQSSVTYTLPSNVENLILTGGAIDGTGNTLNNVITGTSANNNLSGGTGADTMVGGAGDDTYVVDNTGDVVTENASEGTDRIQSSVTYTLGNNVENLTLTGTSKISGTGNTSDNYIIGNSAINTLTGGAGNDTLDGGAGADKLFGGTGDDTYTVDNTSDAITENAGEGMDTVRSSVTFTLGNNLENLTLTGTSAINGTGNTLDNYLTGNSAANSLTAGAGNDILDGGVGADTMIGGIGNDAYVVDNTSDVVTENASEGTDTVQSSISYTLGNNVENLTLTGTSAVNGTGNTLDNVLTGNSANNTLTGNAGNDTLSGGAGNDSLVGGTGNDIYGFMRGDGQDTITDYDTTPGNSDKVQFGSGINPIDVILVNSGNNLDIQINDTPDLLTVQNQNSGSANQVEVFEASDGSQLLSSQVGLLIQAMADFSAQNGGMSWTELIDQKPAEVQQILAQYWQPPQ